MNTKSEWQMKQRIQRQYRCTICGFLGHSLNEVLKHMEEHTDEEIEKGEGKK